MFPQKYYKMLLFQVKQCKIIMHKLEVKVNVHSLLFFQSHMETHKRRQLLQGEAGKIKCPQCDYSHDDQFYIDCHVKLQHEGAEQLICPHCDFSSQTTYR